MQYTHEGESSVSIQYERLVDTPTHEGKFWNSAIKSINNFHVSLQL